MKYLILSLMIMLSGVQLKDSNLYSKSAILMDGESGRVLYGKNEKEILANASTTKILTCILAIENGRMDDVVTVSSYASSMPDVQLNIREGEKYYLKDLLYSLMLESHNDSAVAIAEHIAGSTEKFSNMMNEKARELGCFDTYFITPNGLDAENEKGKHSTTTYDLALIMKYCIQNKEFLKITRTNSHSFSDVNGTRKYSVNNKNALLNSYEGLISGKTGFTGDAGYCYVGACKRDEKTYVIALLACGWPPDKTRKWSDSKKLFEYGIKNYEYIKYSDIELDKNLLKNIKVIDGKRGYANLQYKTEMNKDGRILINKSECATVEYDIPKEIKAPIYKGEIYGYVKYLINGDVYHCIPIVSSEEIEKIDMFWCFKKVFEIFSLNR